MERRMIESKLGKLLPPAACCSRLLRAPDDDRRTGRREGLVGPSQTALQSGQPAQHHPDPGRDDLVRSDIRYMPNVKKYLTAAGNHLHQLQRPYPLCGLGLCRACSPASLHNNDVLSNFRPMTAATTSWPSCRAQNQKNSLGPWMQKAGYRTGFCRQVPQ